MYTALSPGTRHSETRLNYSYYVLLIVLRTSSLSRLACLVVSAHFSLPACNSLTRIRQRVRIGELVLRHLHEVVTCTFQEETYGTGER